VHKSWSIHTRIAENDNGEAPKVSDRAYSPSVPFDSRGPVAKKVPHVLTRPTGDVNDPYYWISNRDDPDTIAYLEAENQHCERSEERRVGKECE
jgi:hypothetical protein